MPSRTPPSMPNSSSVTWRRWIRRTSGGFCPSRVAGILLALVAIGAPASPQQVPARAEGRVVRVARGDTLPVARQRVVLHHISREVQGPIDSALTDPRGHFAFRFKPDTAAVYLISARYAGVEYFSA